MSRAATWNGDRWTGRDEPGETLINAHWYEISKPEPSIEKFANELEKLGQEIKDVAKLTAR